MKKGIFFFIIFIIFSLQTALSQKQKQVRKAQVWTITDKTAGTVPSAPDTVWHDFPNNTAVNNYSIANAYNGTLGSPLQSKIYFDRTEKTDFLFSRPFDAYFLAPTDIPFFNTRLPYAHLIYNNTGSKLNKEDRFSALFSINANKKLNFSGFLDFIAGRGVYEFQATAQSKAGLWSSYSGRRYAYNAIFMYHRFNAEENGGITNDGYLLDKELNNIDPVQIPVNLSGAVARYRNMYFYYNHKVNIIDRKREIDSVRVEYLPVLSLAHNFKVEEAQKRYWENNPVNFYENTYLSPDSTRDSTSYLSIRNNVALVINEGFTRWFPLGITAYVEHEFREYYNRNDSLNRYSNEKDNILIGAEMAKRQGKALLFDVNGELYMIGKRAGDFKIDGSVSSRFRLFKDTVSIRAEALIKNSSPSYFENNYVSNHFHWHNDFGRTFRTRINAVLGWENRWLNAKIGVGMENITNMIFFDEKALPAQRDGNIQVLSVKADVNLKFGVWNWKNKLVYQQTSDAVAVPLPDFSAYSNMFAYFRLFKKALGLQVGIDLYYHTAYHAPAYMPATGVFYSQQHTKVGNYPLMSGYLNFKIKTANFYIKYYNFGSLFLSKTYFSMPNYPLYPARIQLGVSWKFFD